MNDANGGSDQIALRGIRAWGRHGANPGEDAIAQPIDIDLLLDVDVRAARASDELGDTIDYAALHAAVVRVVGGDSCRLLERLGERILEVVMGDERITGASVTLAKTGLLDGATPSVTVGRSR